MVYWKRALLLAGQRCFSTVTLDEALKNFWFRLVSMTILLCMYSSTVLANSDFFSNIDVKTGTAEQNQDRRVNYKGFIQIKTKYGIATPDQRFAFDRDAAGLSQLQADLFFESDTDINDQLSFRLSGKAEFDFIEWDRGRRKENINRERVFLRDAFLDATFGNGHWIRAGHQLFAWGESEALTITDVLAPTDQREFGQAELLDIREQIPAILYSFPIGNAKLSLVGTWDAGHNRYADSEEEFYPYISLVGTGVTLREKAPDKLWEIAIKFDKQFNGGDISLVATDINDNDFVIVSKSTDTATFNLEQKRLQVLGASANRVWNSFLFNGEAAIYRGQASTGDNGEIFLDNQFRASFGIEYSGINDWIFSYEINTIQSLESDITNDGQARRSFGSVVHLQNTALNERIRQHLWYFDLVQDNGSILRWNLDYDWDDNWSFGAATVFYKGESNESQLYPFRNHDTLNLSIKYSY